MIVRMIVSAFLLCLTGTTTAAGNTNGTYQFMQSISGLKPAGNYMDALESYYCSLGWSQNGAFCEQEVDIILPAAESTSYSCDEPYTLNEDHCEGEVSINQPALVQQLESCEDGWTLDEGQCVQKYPAIEQVMEECEEGSTLSSSGQCEVYEPATENVTETCNDGWTMWPGSTGEMSCVKFERADQTSVGVEPVGGYCDIDHFQDYDGLCYKYLSQPTNEVVSYTCANGTLDGDSCLVSQEEPIERIELSCVGTDLLNDETCSRTVDASINEQYYCQSGWTLQGEFCVGTQHQSLPAQEDTNFYCNDEFELVGTNCVGTETDSIAASVEYSCPIGWTLVAGGRCKENIR